MSGPFASPRKLATEQVLDPRWSREFAVAFEAREPVGVLALYRPKNGRATDPTYDLSKHFPDGCEGLNQAIYIGGYRNFEAGCAIASRLPAEHADQLEMKLISFAVKHVCDQGFVAAALYVRDCQSHAFRAGFGSKASESVIADEATIVLDGKDFSAYVAALPSSGRKTVRRDLRRFSTVGLHSEVRPARELIRPAAPLVAAVKIKHGLVDHQQLAAYRLESWISNCPGTHVAFVVSDEAGQLLCVSFACGYQDSLTIYETGMADNPSAERHLAYLQALVYSPVEYSVEHGHAEIRLGLAVGPAKTLRGAIATPMRAFVNV